MTPYEELTATEVLAKGHNAAGWVRLEADQHIAALRDALGRTADQLHRRLVTHEGKFARCDRQPCTETRDLLNTDKHQEGD